MSSTITSIGYYVPDTIRSNAELALRLNVPVNWIIERTGIQERRIAIASATSELILAAAEDCLSRSNISPQEIDLILVATVTPDYQTPSVASIIQHKMGASRAWGYDLSAACSGFIYGLITAHQFIQSGGAQRVLVCAADIMSGITNLDDRKTAVLFGDGAGAALVEKCSEPTAGIIDYLCRNDGSGLEEVFIPAGGSRTPSTAHTLNEGKQFLYMAGKPVAEAALSGMTQITRDLMARNQLTVQDIDWYVPHQGNLRMVEAIAHELQMPMERVMVNLQRYGNTSAASIPICLAEGVRDGRLKNGDRLLLCSIGAGYTFGGLYMKWGL